MTPGCCWGWRSGCGCAARPDVRDESYSPFKGPPPAPHPLETVTLFVMARLRGEQTDSMRVSLRTGPHGFEAVYTLNGELYRAQWFAAETAASSGESAESESTAYLQDASGRFVYDPAVPEERAAALVAQLRAGEGTSESFAEAMGEASYESVGDWLTRAGIVQ